jgi:hypothetical protein
VELHGDNQIVVSWRSIRARAQIVRITPDLSLVLSTSWLTRTALRGVLTWKPELQTYVAQQDTFVYILCGRIPAVSKYRYWWQHVSEVQVRTAPGRLVLNLAAKIR